MEKSRVNRYFSTTKSLRLDPNILDPVVTANLVDSCTQYFLDSVYTFKTLISKMEYLDTIAQNNGYENIFELDEKYIGPNLAELEKDLGNVENLSADGQTQLARGKSIYNDSIQSLLKTNNLSFEPKSKVLSALSDAQSLSVKAELNLEGRTYF